MLARGFDGGMTFYGIVLEIMSFSSSHQSTSVSSSSSSSSSNLPPALMSLHFWALKMSISSTQGSFPPNFHFDKIESFSMKRERDRMVKFDRNVIEEDECEDISEWLVER